MMMAFIVMIITLKKCLLLNTTTVSVNNNGISNNFRATWVFIRSGATFSKIKKTEKASFTMPRPYNRGYAVCMTPSLSEYILKFHLSRFS